MFSEKMHLLPWALFFFSKLQYYSNHTHITALRTIKDKPVRESSKLHMNE